MRRINAILSAVILILFLIHAIMGALQLIGVTGVINKVIAWGMMALVVAHTVLGIILTIKTLKIWKRTGVAYFRENKIFWTRRISGFAVMLLLLFHVTAFGNTENGIYRLKWFTTFHMITQLVLLLAIAVHVLSNIKPLFISLGIRSLKERVPDILFALSILLLVMAGAFIIYYLRWNL